MVSRILLVALLLCAAANEAASADEFTLFGAQYEATHLVICFDATASTTVSGESETIRAQVEFALGQFANVNFSLVTVRSSPVVFSSGLLEASPANLALASDWLDALDFGGERCLTDGLQTALDIVGDAEDPLVIVVSTGADTCFDPLGSISNPNCTIIATDPYYLVPELTEVVLGSRSCGRPFLRGDTNSDGVVDVSDVATLLTYLFGPTATVPCPDANDVDDDGEIDLADALRLLEHLFVGGGPLPDPGVLACAPDPTLDFGFTCQAYDGCP